MSNLSSNYQHNEMGFVPMYTGNNKIKKYFSFLGVGIMVAVGYMDPGNWATDIAGGSLYEYRLLFVIAISSILAMLLQFLALKLGIATDKDLAKVCSTYLPKYVNLLFWFLCEIAIIACDLAELLGAAIALKLLFNIPILIGVTITLFDVVVILYLHGRGFRYLEILIITLVATIFFCFGYELLTAQPQINNILQGLIPSTDILGDSKMLFIAVGILGATVMPHNLYLHSSLVKTRNYKRTIEGKKEAIHYATWDSSVSLFLAFFVNVAILILAASVFYGTTTAVEEIEKAYVMLSPALGDQWASIIFAVALLCAGQSSTITGTLAGQIVMEGFLDIKIARWKRRIMTRLLAIIPAFLVIWIGGEDKTTELLIISQVILSMQLGFAVIPLVYYTSSKKIMGPFRNNTLLRICSWTAGVCICVLNLYLLWDFFIA